MRSLLVTFLTLATACDAAFTACNLAELAQHQKNLDKDLGIDETLDWKSLSKLRKAVETVYATQKMEGLRKVCSAFKQYKASFGGDYVNYQACTEYPLGLLLDATMNPTGIKRAEATGYVKFIAQFDFACGAGFGIFANMDQCLGDRFKNATDKLTSCQATFEYQVLVDPGNACIYASTASACYRDVFADPCGAAGGWWGCEYERIGTSVNYPQCTQNFCSVNKKPV